MNDPRQNALFDPYDPVLSDLARARLEKNWQGAFRHILLEVMPAGALADHRHACLGRPTKELYSMAGLLMIMEFHNWTVEEAAEAYMLNTGVQYALNLSPGAQSLSERTIERYQAIFRDKELAAQVFEEVTAALAKLVDLRVDEQRLDSTHVVSNMAMLGRTQLMGVAVKRFLTQLKRHDRPAYDALPEALRTRYAPSVGRLFGDTAKDPQARRLLRQQVAEDMHDLLRRFEDTPAHSERTTYQSLKRVFSEQCTVEEERVTVKDKPGGQVMQNPSDPEATYDGKKGPGYQVQAAETCSADNEVQLITAVQPETAAAADAHALGPILRQLEASERRPSSILADHAYGSDANVESAREQEVEVVSPVNTSKRDPEKFHLEDFTIDTHTETVQACPQGHAPVESVYDAGNDTTRTRMDPQHCSACPHRAQCPVLGKQAPVLTHTPAQRRRAERYVQEQQSQFRERYAKRAGIEGIFSAIKQRTGLGRLRVRGRPAVDHAIYLKLAGWNLFQAANARAIRDYVARQAQIAHQSLAGRLRAWSWHVLRRFPRPIPLWQPATAVSECPETNRLYIPELFCRPHLRRGI